MLSTTRTMPVLPISEAEVQKIIDMATNAGRLFDVTASVTARSPPGVTKKTHNPYSPKGPTIKFFGEWALQCVRGYLAHVPFFVPVAQRIVTLPVRAVAEGLVRLAVGCTAYSLAASDLRRVLEAATSCRVVHLEPYTYRDGRRSGLWFIDVAVRDVVAFLAMDRCILMHLWGAHVFSAGSCGRLRAWTDARDRALRHVGCVEGLKPMTIEPSKPFEQMVAAIRAAYAPAA